MTPNTSTAAEYIKTPVVAFEEDCTIIYPSIREAARSYNLSTSQVQRLIENEQNIAHTRIYLDYATDGPELDAPLVFFNGSPEPVSFSKIGIKTEIGENTTDEEDQDE